MSCWEVIAIKELSLNILDIAENSYKAKATLVEILIKETDEQLSFEIRDNGTGMTEEIRRRLTDPFYTTRTTRKVGMGIPLLLLAATQADGKVEIESKHFSEHPETHGTTVTAFFNKTVIDYTPLGDVISTVVTLIQGHPDIDLYFRHEVNGREITLDTRVLRNILEDVPLDNAEVLTWIKESLSEQYCAQ